MIAPLGTFRTLELTNTVNGKSVTVEIVTQASAQATDTGDGFHSLNGIVLSGGVTNPKYQAAPKLVGSLLSSTGGLSPDGPPHGGATRGQFKFALVPDLTDPIPEGESLADSVARVTSFLQSKGFIQFVP